MFHVKRDCRRYPMLVRTTRCWIRWCGPNLFVIPATKEPIHKVIHSDIHRVVHTFGPKADLAPCVVVASLPHTMMKSGPRNHNLPSILFPIKQAVARLASRFILGRAMIRRDCNCGRFPVSGPNLSEQSRLSQTAAQQNDAASTNSFSSRALQDWAYSVHPAATS